LLAHESEKYFQNYGNEDALSLFLEPLKENPVSACEDCWILLRTRVSLSFTEAGRIAEGVVGTEERPRVLKDSETGGGKGERAGIPLHGELNYVWPMKKNEGRNGKAAKGARGEEGEASAKNYLSRRRRPYGCLAGK